MGSIGSTLNSINSSLLNEIQAYNQTVGASSSTSQSSPSSSADRIDFSQISQLYKQLQQLQTSNPAEFKQVLTDAAGKLKDAASQQTDLQAAAFLNNLASRFQTAADTGDLSALQPQSSTAATGQAQGHHHHHHHGGGNGGTTTTTDSSQGGSNVQSLLSLLNSNSVQPNSNASQIQSLLASFVSQNS